MVAALRGLGLQAGATLHALVASHGHLDHVGGCEELLQEYRVPHLYEAWYDGADAPQSYARFREQLRAEGGVVHVLAETPALDGEVTFQAGDHVDLPEAARGAGARAEILWPPGFQGSRWDDIAESKTDPRPRTTEPPARTTGLERQAHSGRDPVGAHRPPRGAGGQRGEVQGVVEYPLLGNLPIR